MAEMNIIAAPAKVERNQAAAGFGKDPFIGKTGVEQKTLGKTEFHPFQPSHQPGFISCWYAFDPMYKRLIRH
jgi:hypothetical protein